jgi:hypothetical protein
MAWEAIDNLETDMIAIYDRNFSNFKTIALHLYSEQQPRFVIRAKEHMRMVKTFLKTGLQSQELDMYPGKSGIDGMRKAGFIVNKRTALRVRMIRVELNNGITEVLFTNLWEAEGYESALFQELYMKRWGIETCIGISKNLLQLESMSGLSEESVYQDFYATIFMTNLASLLGRQGTDEVQKKHLESSKKYKWEVKVNMNKGSGELRRRLTELFLNDDPPRIIQNLVDYFCRHVSPIRPGRSYKRKRINKLFNCKHRTYSNYKPST